MRRWRLPAVFLAALFACCGAQAAPAQSDSSPAGSSALSQMVDKIVQREKQLMAQTDRYTPLVELYVQDVRPTADLGPVPAGDSYYIGQGDFSKGIRFRPLDLHTGNFVDKLTRPVRGIFSGAYEPDGFIDMIYPDARGLDQTHYTFNYLHQDFLGDVRCLVFDVIPKPHAGQGRFKGRIWVEDRHFTIVRFNGVFTPAPMFGMYFHFDSWRVNVAPGVWLPGFIYSQEDQKGGFLKSSVRFRAQMRLWGYNLSPAAREEELSRILVQADQPIQDQSQANSDYSPVAAQRAFEDEAERNVLDRLQSIGLLAPPGPVDQVLDTVVNNLVVSNNLNIQPAVHCRVLMTTPLEAFAVGHTIVLSRGLVDVLPDEPSLATVLAQELAEIVLGHSIDTQYAFGDRTIFNVQNTFHVLDFQDTPAAEMQASTKAVQFLQNSPYKDSLGKAGLFLKALQAESKDLPQLISPHLGNRPEEISALENMAPQLQLADVKQIAALPLGSRIEVDPWNDDIRMMNAAPVALLSASEKMPFELAPFYLNLQRVTASASAALPPPAGAPEADPAPATPASSAAAPSNPASAASHGNR